MMWILSVFVILLSYFLFDRGGNFFNTAASLVGVTSLIYCAKGSFVGPLLSVVFSVLYGVISLTFDYYGEMITYLGMTAPMSALSLIAWIRNPADGERSEVRVNRIGRREMTVILLLTVVVTVIFRYVLEALNTANLIPSTVSVATSFLAVSLTFRRSPYYALAYAANDVVLILLWGMALPSDLSYLSVVLCFVMFLFNDIYGFVCWRRMQRRQQVTDRAAQEMAFGK